MARSRASPTFLQATAGEIHRASMPLLRGAQIPVQRLLMILCNAAPVEQQVGEVVFAPVVPHCRCLENGWGTEADLRKAAASYASAAAMGHDWGEYNLANLLFDGRGVAQNHEQALYWYLRAAQQGHGRAMNLAGRCLEEGWGCTRAPAEAAEWYRRSAESGYFRGQFNYALVLAQQGNGALAANWFWKAAEGGDDAMRRAIVAAVGGASDPALVDLRTRLATLS